jgi:hypothetical protein
VHPVEQTVLAQHEREDVEHTDPERRERAGHGDACGVWV